MKLERLTTGHLEELNQLYIAFFFPNGRETPLYVTDYLLESIVKEITNYGSYNPRLGSRWTPHSKLDIKRDLNGNVVVQFEPNFAPDERDTDRHREALETGKAFQHAFLRYLSEQEEGENQ